MKPLAHFLLLLATCAAFVATGCSVSSHAKKGSPSKQGSPAFLQAFSDFEFVGSGPISDDEDIPSHGINGKPLPLRLNSNLLYVFHHRLINDHDEGLFEVLKNRLQANGVTILEAKMGPLVFIGPPNFHISFQEGNYRGTIFTSLDWRVMNTPTLYDQWDTDDYILLLKDVESKN